MDETERKDAITSTLDALMEARSLEDRAVFLFGHCNATEEMADYLLDVGMTPIAILDNNTAKQGMRYCGIPVVRPDTILGQQGESSIVLIASRHYAAMASQLRQLHYDGAIVQVVEYDTFAAYSLSAETIDRMEVRMLRGAETLKNIRSAYPAQHLVVCPYNALGDVYWAMAFLPAYCEKNGITNVAVIVAGSGCGEVARLFGHTDVLTLTQGEIDELVQALVYKREGNCIIAHHDRPYTDNAIRYLDKHFVSFIDYYRCIVYGLAQDATPTEPLSGRPYTGEPQLQHSRSVILAPYAKSMTQAPKGFWEDLAAAWQNKGQHVYTLVNGDEKAIAGTAALGLPLDQLAAAVEQAGVFIGLRNGLCDIAHMARCRKIVVYPDCFYSTTPHKVEDFFALPGWEKIVV